MPKTTQIFPFLSSEMNRRLEALLAHFRLVGYFPFSVPVIFEVNSDDIYQTAFGVSCSSFCEK